MKNNLIATIIFAFISLCCILFAVLIIVNNDGQSLYAYIMIALAPIWGVLSLFNYQKYREYQASLHFHSDYGDDED